MIPEYDGKPVSFVSVNIKNPKGQVNAELKKFRKKYNMNYPSYYGRGQNMDKDFKVMKLPRIILVRPDGTIYKDELFLKEDKLRIEIDKLVAELPVEEEEPATGE